MKKMVMIAACTAALLCGCMGMANDSAQVQAEPLIKIPKDFDQTFEYVPGSTDLVFDTTTKNVFIKNSTYGFGNDVYVPYPAPNGLPYQYDEATKSLVENDSLEELLEELKEN